MEDFVDTDVIFLAGRFFLLVLLRMGMNSDGVFSFFLFFFSLGYGCECYISCVMDTG